MSDLKLQTTTENVITNHTNYIGVFNTCYSKSVNKHNNLAIRILINMHGYMFRLTFLKPSSGQ
jgi:hypothetical protein